MPNQPAPSFVHVVTSTTGTYDEAVTVPVLATSDRGLAERRVAELLRASALDAIARRNAVPDQIAWWEANPSPEPPRAPVFDRTRTADKDYQREHQLAMERHHALTRAFQASPELAAHRAAAQSAYAGALETRRAEADAHPEVELALADETYAIHQVPLI